MTDSTDEDAIAIACTVERLDAATVTLRLGWAEHRTDLDLTAMFARLAAEALRISHGLE